MFKAWNAKQIRQHMEAAQKLATLKQEFQTLLIENPTISEIKCLEFIRRAYKKHGLVNDNKKEFAIVAFGKNTNQVHYFPKPKTALKLKTNTLILLDMWARLNQKGAPYADVTFMFYFGSKVPKKIQETWKVLVASRSAALRAVKNKKLPKGLDIDRFAHDVIGNAGLGHGIKHTIGHSLGLNSPHGTLPGINWREYLPLIKNMGYTIEPGIYLKDFGMRTEIDFYINAKGQTIITTPLQDILEKI